MDEMPEAFEKTVKEFLAQSEIPAIRKTKSGMKPCDIRPTIYGLNVQGNKLQMLLALCEKATCKPDLLLSSLFSFAGVERPRMLVTRLQMMGEKNGAFVPLETL